MNSLIFTVIQTKKGCHTDLHNTPAIWICMNGNGLQLHS